MSQQSVVSIARRGDIAVVTVSNPPVNALSKALRQGLWDAVVECDADAGIRAVILSCAGRTFIAGADVREFGAAPQPPHLPDLIDRIEAAAKPWIAAIHGAALGGGFEVAMGCRWRVAAPDAQVGLPEVNLGILPGAGGTVRTPRLIGMEKAVAMVTGGKPVKAQQALADGLIDAIVTGDLVDGTEGFIRGELEAPLPEPIRARPVTPMPDEFWATAEKTATKSAKGNPGPIAALKNLRAAESDFDAAMASERAAFLELRGKPEAAALRHVFFAERAATRPPELKGISPRNITRTAVIGGGTMGAGIAAALRDADLPVVLVERDDKALARGMANLRKIYEGSLKRGRITEAQLNDHMSGVIGATDYAALADTDLVIEAVFEDLAVKREVFTRLASTCRTDAILATNTSYLDPAAIAADVPHPERFIGLHFFSPAHIMKLLEIVPTNETAPEVLATGFALAARLRKIPVRAGICDGFIGNRILKTTRAQAERLLLAGAEPAQVDAAMRNFGMPMGPFEAQDLGGLDIAAFQRKAARERGESPFAPVADQLVEAGRLGQKTGGGWYDYAPGDRKPLPSTATAEAIARVAGEPANLSPQEMAEVILLPMIDEGARILCEGIALRASDIDLVKIHGYGFPRPKGGPMHWAESQGLASILDKLSGYADRGLAPKPSGLLRRAAAVGHWPE